MRKLLLLLICLGLVGCSVESAKLSDFELKEKCSQYISTVEKRVDGWNETSLWESTQKTFEGVYYSKDKDTCLSIVSNYYVSTKETQKVFTDELSGQILYFGKSYGEAEIGYKLLK